MELALVATARSNEHTISHTKLPIRTCLSANLSTKHKHFIMIPTTNEDLCVTLNLTLVNETLPANATHQDQHRTTAYS